MKPLEGKYQTATQVKGLSPEKAIVREVDGFLAPENKMIHTVTARYVSLSRGRRPWYDIEWNLWELGISGQFPQERIFADNLKKKGSGDDCPEVGLTHSRGVIGVTSYESGSEGYSKGLALIRKGKEKHNPDTERRKCGNETEPYIQESRNG